ncbi:MAG: hypothetical protein JWN41_489 [Thermoleophilia bacterium]|nr:hypothetical protein [Thermoleophilia bacterium]
MRDTSCRREDVISAFEDLCRRLEDRRTALWSAYGDATSGLSKTEYASIEHECWHVLEAGLAGLDAEHRMLRSSLDQRLALIEGMGAVA